MKRLLYTVYILVALAIMASCQRDAVEEFVPQKPAMEVPEGYTYIEFKANISDIQRRNTRAVDPDGLHLSNMTLFCFNEFGLYISSEEATLTSYGEDSGHFKAIIPNHTQIIHFIGNHSEGLFDESEFPGQTESMVIANMEGGSGMLVYWSRFQMDVDSDKSISEQLMDLSYTIKGTTYEGVKLIRNQAKVTIENWETDDFIVTGYRTVNIPAFGTVAPHHPNDHFHIVDNWEDTEDFVTLPNNQSIMSDITEINTKPEDYIFETENSGERLVSVIIRGHRPSETEANDKYYRVVLQHEDGSNFMIRRNHNYNIQITGMLSFGQDSFEKALTAPASNNAWISIDEWVNEISDGTETMWVEQTVYVLSSDEYAGTNWTIPYKYTKGGKGDAVAPTVTWIDNNVAYDNITNNYNTSTGEGSITLYLYPMYEGNEQQVGSFLIKHGKLQRKITVYLIRTQHFTPSWVSTQVYGVAKEFATIIFTIPETCPEALFPFTVLVSVNHLDVRSDSGQQLPVYTKGEEGYFGADWENINYKYAYTVTGPGKHRLHMQSLLQHTDGELEEVHLEAEFFETITKNVVFTGYDHVHRRIFVDNLRSYGNAYAEDEELYYMLVPQKRAHPLVFTIMLQERQSDGTYKAMNHAANPGSEQWHKNGRDEFLIYSKTFSDYRTYYNHNEDVYEEIQGLAWDGDVILFNESYWSTNGRVMAFRTQNYKTSATTEAELYGLQEDGTYNIYFLTNSANNKDVVRVASNNAYSYNAFPNSRDSSDMAYGTKMYEGNEYRSVIFDVAHYRPYRFAAQVKVSDAGGGNSKTIPTDGELLSNVKNGDQEESVDDVILSYKPGQKVDILFDITSFKGSDGCSVHPFGENFGDHFEVYIDAPMLEIDYDRYPENWRKAANDGTGVAVDKLRPHPTIPGRFIYTVDRHREHGHMYGSLPAANKDESQVQFNQFGQKVPVEGSIDQSGERKCLPFKKTSITAGGDIHITTDKDRIVFWDKTFNVETEHIKGEIYYQGSDGVPRPIPHNAFVAFVRLRTGARIGVATIYDDGKFELNLREEYTYGWNDDPIDFYYTTKDSAGNDITYNFNYMENGEKRSVDLELLYNLTKRQEPIPIVLTIEQEISDEN
ncbi:MAG: hypothetical protein J6U93_08315 [Alistipes sp.]|nr:hypothetical protein [Alistipes sp.]